MLDPFFANGAWKGDLSVVETFDSFSLTFSNVGEPVRFIDALFEEIKRISERDSFELFVDVSGTNETSSTVSEKDVARIMTHVRSAEIDDNIEVELNIDKKCVDSTLSVYFYNVFVEYLLNEKLNNVFSTFSKYIDSKLFFEVQSEIETFYTSSIAFHTVGSHVKGFEMYPEHRRESCLEMFGESSGGACVNTRLVPNDFNFIEKPKRLDVKKLFDTSLSVLCVVFISNTSDFVGDECFSYKINGYKAVSGNNVRLDSLCGSAGLLYKIYAWAYEGGNRSDKLGLVRNVLSIHLDSDGSIIFDNEAWVAINSNYQVYLKDNLQSYLDVKNKIGEFIIESTSKTYDMADELLDSLKNNMLVLLTFVLSVVVVNGLKDNGVEGVFSDEYLFIVIALSSFSLIWLYVIKTEAISRFDSSSLAIKDILVLNYSNVIMDSEIEETVDPVVAKNRVYLKGQLNRYSKWWLFLVFVFVLFFVVANYIYGNAEGSDGAESAEIILKGCVSPADDRFELRRLCK